MLLLNQRRFRLIQLSFLMLFVELTLIRWAGANIYALSFFSNFILLASFLGIGLGFIRSASSKSIFPIAPFCLAIFVLLTYLYSYEYHIRINPSTNDLNFISAYFKENLFPVELTLPIIFLAVMLVMMTLADGVARVFQQFPPLEAYRSEMIGSLLGVITFSFLSWLHTSPWVWGCVISLIFMLLFIPDWRLKSMISIIQIMSLVLLMGTFSKEAMTNEHHWSQYYKIDAQPYSEGRYAIIVNGWPQQFVESVQQRERYKPFYFLPYQHLPPHAILNNVLVIGAGTGGDVAIALAQGAKHVDAVEIDPVLYQLGKKINPDQPYHDSRVHIYIDDGRSFLQKNHQRYDMILFALPDSLMVLSGRSSLRLENYLFTIDGITMARKHLSPNGIFTMYNYYRERWLIDRLANTLTLAFHHTPCFDTYGEINHWLSVLSISKSSSSIQCKNVWQPQSNQFLTPSTDDHPFLYLKENTITSPYIAASLFVLITALSALKLIGGSYYSIKNYFDLFLMGMAFLLLESKSIVTFALLFGSTWFVNALVFIGILLTIYFAVEISYLIKGIRSIFLYSLLFGTLLLAWATPNELLLSLPFFLRFMAATMLAFFPILAANLIFSKRFGQTVNSTAALGANMMGAVAGGLLEYISLLIGYRHLLLVVVGLYLLAILFMQRSEKHQLMRFKSL